MEKKKRRALRRHNDWKKAIRKHRIVLKWGWEEGWYDNLHQYSKNKIHCSCPMCACKTRGITVRKSGGPGENWPLRDSRRIQEMKDQEKEE